MRITDTADLWWKNAVVYCLDVETYLDWDGDGCGDLAGLAQRIDHLADLGVTCLWLMPFYPTAERDDGYDITDFYGVDPRLGTHGDLVEVIRTAKDRGMRVIADLVVNHTSIRHPWFQRARQSRDDPFHDFYVWRDDEPPDTSDQVVFPDQEQSLWTFNEPTGEWYQHRFYKEQPDLNVADPRVRDEVAKIMGFWLQLGLSGFRVDAVPFFLEVEPDDAGDLPDPHQYLRALRQVVGRRTGDGILLGEVNLPHEQQVDFFGGADGDELTMLFDFVGMQALYLSLARHDARPLAQALGKRPRVHPDCQWATFVRNHDELTLDKLSESERQEVFAAFGPEPAMQLYGRGLKRRLPTMLGGDPRRIRMVYSLLFSLPGTPTLYYGEEIGMGEDLEAEGRAAVRTPMQWYAGPNGGFSSAPPRRLIQRPVPGGYGPDNVNVAAQKHDPGSLWSFMRELIQTYRECPELGWGEFMVLPQRHREVLAHRCHWQGSSVIAVHNLGGEPVVTELSMQPDDLDGGPPVLEDLFSHETFEIGADDAVTVTLDGYGHRWLRVRPHGAPR